MEARGVMCEQGEIHFLEILLELYWHELVRLRDDKVPFTDALTQRAHKESAAGNTIIFFHAASTERSCNFFKKHASSAKITRATMEGASMAAANQSV